MEILQINEININKLDNYVLNINLKEYLDFYKLRDNSEYLEMIKKNIMSQNSISLVAIENNNVVGFMIGGIFDDDELKSKVAKVKYVTYENSSNYESLLNKFEQIAKLKGCEYISVCTPEFQREELNLLNSNGFSNYKVELEKELI